MWCVGVGLCIAANLDHPADDQDGKSGAAVAAGPAGRKAVGKRGATAPLPLLDSATPRQTFVFSATLAMEHLVPHRVRPVAAHVSSVARITDPCAVWYRKGRQHQKGKGYKQPDAAASAAGVGGMVERLMRRLPFRAPGPKVLDLTAPQVVAPSLTERRIFCDGDEKDLYLYYFVTRFPGRTLVFVNRYGLGRRAATVQTQTRR